MAIVKLNELIQGVSGTIGDLELSRRGAKTIVRQKPELHPRPTPARLAARQRFREAAIYGRAIQETPTLRAAYAVAASARGVAPYHLALTDFLNPPEVTALDLTTLGTTSGRPIRIQAIDDFEVVRVWLSLRTVTGEIVEEGDAVLDRASGQWLYAVQNDVPPGQTIVAEATAVDRPGHAGSKTLFWWVP